MVIIRKHQVSAEPDRPQAPPAQLATGPSHRLSLVASAAGTGEATVDSHLWTGEVEAQRREGRTFLVLLILIVALASPFAVWLALYLSRILLTAT
jgi:hypothetical protein